MLSMTESDAYQTPVTRLIDEHGKCLARIAELEAQLAEIHASARRMSFDAEWYPGGVRTPPGDYVIMRLGPVKTDEPEF